MPFPRSPLADIKQALARRGQMGSSGSYVRVSGIEQCARRQSLLRTGPPSNPTNWQSAYNMEEGNWAEAGMVPLLNYAGWEIVDAQKELDLYEYDESGDSHLILRGHIDGLIHPSGYPEAVGLWENKFLGGYGFEKIQSAGLEYGNPAYYTQAQVYMHLLRREYPTLDTCVFHVSVKDPAGLFKNRGKQPDSHPDYIDPMYEEFVTYNEAHALDRIERARWLYWGMKDGGLMPMERTPQVGKTGDWDCTPRFCPVYDRCNPRGGL